MKVTLIAGLPGSGKSTLARQLANDSPCTLVIDDPDRLDCLDRLLDACITDAVVSHPAFCRPAARTMAEQEIRHRRPDAVITWVFFANDPAACLANVQVRADGREVSYAYVRMLSKDYDLPSSADVRQVYVSASPMP
jgi:predicted ATPase